MTFVIKLKVNPKKLHCLCDFLHNMMAITKFAQRITVASEFRKQNIFNYNPVLPDGWTGQLKANIFFSLIRHYQVKNLVTISNGIAKVS